MKTAFAVLVLASLARGSQQDTVARTKRLDDYRVIITCTNNADPTGFSLGHNTIVVSCADERRVK